MRVLIAEVAVAGLKHPVPVVVEPLANRHDLRRRAAPKIEVEPFGTGAGVSTRPMLCAIAVANGAGELDLADLAAVNEVERLAHAGHAAALHAHLAHAAELAGPLRHHAAFVDVVAARLLDVDVFAGLHRPHGHHGVPVIRRGDRDGVDVFVFKQLAHVRVVLRFLASVFHLLASFFVSRFVEIADRNEIDIGQLRPFADVCTALAVHANDRHANFFIGTDPLDVRSFDGEGLRHRASGQRGRCGEQGAFDKITA